MINTNEKKFIPKLFSGKNSYAKFAQEITQKTVIFLTFPQITESIKNQLSRAFPTKEIKFISYPFGYPDIAEIDGFYTEFWADIDVNNTILIAVGGGSVLDCAKVLRFSSQQNDWLPHYLDKPFSGDNFIKLPLALIPTSSGTGSEVTPTATIWNRENSLKHSFYGEEVYADYAIVSGEFSLGNSWIASRDAALDALSHALEAIWNVNRTDETTESAILSARIITRYLPKLNNNLDDTVLRNHLSCASLMAGLAMSKTQTALAHALSYELTLKSEVSHGAAVAYWLPYTWQLLNQSNDERGKILIKKALFRIGSSPQNLSDWLTSLGISCHPLDDNSAETRDKLATMLNSPRGKNFNKPLEVMN